MEDLLIDASKRASRYISGIRTRRVAPSPEDIAGLSAFQEPLPEEGDPLQVLSLLDEAGSPATVASAGGRYFGFVTGGALPAALAANWLAGAWDQNVAFNVMSPVAATLEDVVLGWLRDLFGLPASCSGGFVSGATMANLTCLAAARHALLERAGWNVEEHGLFGAPPLSVVVGDEVHVSLLKALSLLGLGRARVTRVPTDGQGRLSADLLPQLDDRTIVCIQAGNVNTGAFDPAAEICSRAREAKAWVHVDGAFGLWAATAPKRAGLIAGFSEADSWATDCHKWLNVPYDSGLAFVREPEYLRAAMAIQAAYLPSTDSREPSQYTPESSRRGRVVEVWAALRSLGRRGLADMIERHCQFASRFAEAFRAAGYQVLNEVVLNQVLVSFGDAEATRLIASEIQKEGTCWCGATQWQGQTAMRISVCSWATTEDDVDQSAAAILRIAGRFTQTLNREQTLRFPVLYRRRATMAFQNLVEEVQVMGRDLVDRVKALIHEGNVQRIIIKDEHGHTFVEIPVTVGVIGLVLAPVLAAVGAISALVAKFTIVIERSEPRGPVAATTPEAEKHNGL